MRFIVRSYSLTESGRRAMVNKIWCQEITRTWFHKKDEPPHARVFSEPRCRQYTTTWYLLYRWLIFAAWATIIVCSIFEFGSFKPLIAYDKWPIYLTNWDLLLGLSQALLGGIIVSKRWKIQRVPGFDPSTLQLGSLDRVYWFLYVITTNLAIGVTFTYWCSVYNPAIHYLDPLNFMLHVCNSILMVVDFCVTNIPFRFRNFWWCLIIVFMYIIFSVIYYSAGGMSKHGEHYIYKVLDWKKPLPTLLVCIGEVIFMTVLHMIMCFLDRIKDRVYVKLASRTMKTIAHDQEGDRTSVQKSVDIV